MASSFLNAAGTIGRVTINERIEAGRRERRVLARQHKSRDAQDPVPILVTGQEVLNRMRDAIKAAIQSNATTVRFIAIIIVLAAAAWFTRTLL
jgi:hypothetical protein